MPTRLTCIFAIEVSFTPWGICLEVEQAEAWDARGFAQRLRQKVVERLFVRRALHARAVRAQLLLGLGVRLPDDFRRERRAQRAVYQAFEVCERVLHTLGVGTGRTGEVCGQLFEPRGGARERLARAVVARCINPLLTRAPQRVAAVFEVRRDERPRERQPGAPARVAAAFALDSDALVNDPRRRRSAALRFEPLGELRLDLLLTIEKGLDATVARSRLIRIESLLDAAQHDVKRNAHLLPAFDQRPIEWADEQVLSASANESIFDLAVVVEIVQRRRPLRM